MQKITGKTLVFTLCIFITCALAAQRRADFITIGRMELSEGHIAKAIENLNYGLQLNPTSYDGYYARAIAKEELEDYAGAEDDFSKAIEIYPYRGETYARRAYMRDRIFNYAGALDDYKKSLSIDSSDAEIYVNRAVTYLSLQQFELAIEDCNRAEKMHLRDENLYIVRAYAESQMKKFKEAISDYNKAIEHKPQNARTYVDRGIARVGSGNKDSAMIDYNFALQMDSVNIFAMFHRALLETDTGKNKEALADFNKVILLSPYSVSAYFNRAVLKSKMKDFYGALNDYDAVLNINPDNILTYYNRGNLLYEHNNLPDALKDYTKVIQLYPEFTDAYRNRAEVEKSMNNLKSAAQDEKKANELQQLQNSATDSAKYYEGLKLMKLITMSDDFESPKDTKGKIQYTHNDIKPQPVFNAILFPTPGNKVRVYNTTKKRHYGGSELTLFNKTDSLDSKLIKKEFDQLDSAIYHAPGKASNYANRGIIFSELQAYDHAISDFDKAIDLDPLNALSYFSRANTRLKLLDLQHYDTPEANAKLNSLSPYMVEGNSYEKAIVDYSSAIKLDSTFSYAWYNRATAKMATNDYSGAVDDLTMAVSYDSTFAEAYYNKGLLLVLMHNNETACPYLSRAGELGILEAYAVIKRYCDK